MNRHAEPLQTGTSRRWIWYAVAALPAIIPLFFIFNYSIDFPLWDEWAPGLAGLYVKLHQHRLTFGDLIAQHNEHRILIPRLMLLGLNWLTRFNPIWEMILEWAIICVTSLGVLRLIQRTHERANLAQVAGLWFLCNVLIFTPAQWQDLIWGVGVINVTPMALCVWILVVLAVDRISIARLVIAILLAAAATYSSGNGFLAWPMGLALLAWPDPRGKRAYIIAWLIAAVAFFAPYFIGYQQPDHNGAHPYATDLLGPLLYLLAFLGGPFAFASPFGPESMSIVVGAVMLAALGWVVFYLLPLPKREPEREFCRRACIWLAVAMFAVGSAALAAIGRAGFTPAQALQSRYVTFSLYLPVALIVLTPMVCAHWIERSRPSRWIVIARYAPATTVTAFVLMQIFCYPPIIESCKVEYRTRLQTKAAQLLSNVLPDNPMLERFVYPQPQVARDEANALSEMGWLRPKMITTRNAALIQETDPARVARVKGALERGGKRSATEMAVMGWAAFVDQDRIADAVFLTYDNSNGEPIIFTMAEMGIRRDDVAQELGSTEFAGSGWLAVFSPSVLPRDMKQATIRAWAMETDTGRAVLLPGSTVLQP